MASLKTVLYLGVCMITWIATTADDNFVPKAVHWMSLDFKTILTWTTTAPNCTYTVLYSWDDGDWMDCHDCNEVSESECDLTNYLIPYDRTYSADIKARHVTMDHIDDLGDLPHTFSRQFNPYKESNISAVEFTVEAVDESKVTVNITNPLTSIHKHGKQLSIRDILKNDLQYKISYHKSGSTGKKEIISESSMAEVSELDAGQSYCFMVAAYIPSRPKTTQQGAWSKQYCTRGHPAHELSLGAWVGTVFILLTVLIIIVTVTVLCCRCCQQRSKILHTSQSSAPV
ncbi:tissue factor [Lates calcarifer]|uniref:Tissue factor n=1 Tax=Lates calcarifer TaxID=8187 RepID=A0A4W6D2I1_LATCA|nr:tissue factor [Lates calcarifer]